MIERTDDYIELCSGRRFPLKTPWAWDVEEIAHALGNQCRYTGHVTEFYSVAEHSTLCAALAEETGLCDPFEALMHDAHESLLGDMAKPWKNLIAGYNDIELALETDMRRHYGLPTEVTPGCKKIDMIALFLESRTLMRSKGEGWQDPMHMRPLAYSLHEAGWKVRKLSPKDARNAFIRAYKELETVPSEVPVGRQKAHG